ncbi:uncharacterized protein LOC117653479 isoform X2 [Thrips palmi]|nr:uncharacterized protein LOC117653479 isoform X2 [Thrips palmi]
MAGWCSSLLVVALAVLLVADCTLAQTFSYSRGWKSGKRTSSAAGVAVPSGTTAGGRGADDVLAEDLPLYRYFLEGRGEHRAPYDPWRLVDEPLLHMGRRPALQALQALQQTSEQAAEHEDR